MMILIGKVLVAINFVFFVLYIIGMIKMGPEEFEIWLGELLLAAWRKVKP